MEANTSLCHRSNVRILAPSKSCPFFFFFNFVEYVSQIMKIVLGDFRIMQFCPCWWFLLQSSSMLLLMVDSKLIESHNLSHAALFARALTYICRDRMAGFRAISFVPANRIHTKYFSWKSGKHGKHFCFRGIIKRVCESKESRNNSRPCVQKWHYYKLDGGRDAGSTVHVCYVWQANAPGRASSDTTEPRALGENTIV